MEQPLAIKEQEGVGPCLSMEGSIFTGILCPTVYRCPHCRKIYKVILGPGDVFLGVGHRICSKCQQAFRDGSKEWGMIRSMDRVFFLFPLVIWGWILVALAVCVLLGWFEWTLGTTPVLVPVAIFFVVPLIAWFVFRGYQIVRSVRRFNLHGKAKAA